MLAPGSRIDAYELVAVLGEGGMAQVWTARRRGAHGFEKLLALKVIHSRLLDDERFRAMFLDEARITAAIHHPNVAQVFDLGESEDLLYLVMEYVDGDSLAALVTSNAATNEKRTAPLDVALVVTRDVLAGLHAAHTLEDEGGVSRGVVHRDVSPQNVLLGVRGEVKLIDFGIAIARERLAGETVDGSVKGKLHFMAPEQARQKPLGPTADVFATGAMLHAMLTGRAPFAGANEAETLRGLLSGAPPAIPESIPAPVRAVIAKAIAFDARDRFPTAHAMKVAVDAALDAVLPGARPDLGAWVLANLSPKARARREEAARRSDPDARVGASAPAAPIPDLGLSRSGAGKRSTSRAAHRSWERDDVSASAPPADIPLELDHSARVDSRPPIPAPTRMTNPLAPLDATLPLPPSLLARAAAPAAPPAPAPAPAPVPAPAPPNDAFFDVSALRARAAARPDPDAPAASPSDLRHARPPTPLASPRGRARRASLPTSLVASGALLLFVALLSLFLAAPFFIRRAVTERSQALGLDVSVSAVSLSFDGVTLRDVVVRAVDAPNVVVRASAVRTHGLSTADVRAEDVAIDVAGGIADVAASLDRVHGRLEAGAGLPASTSSRLAVVRGRVAWKGIVGEGSILSAEGAGFQLDQHPRDPKEARRLAQGIAAAGGPPRATPSAPFVVAVAGAAERLSIRTARGTIGPWSGSFHVDGASNRARLLFDPAVPDGPSALYVWGPATEDQLTVNVPRVPLATIGIPLEVVGLDRGASPEIEAHIETHVLPAGRLEATAKIDVLGMKVPGGRAPVDVRVDARAGGVPDGPLALERATASVGPFVANVTGSVELRLAGLRVDTAWKVSPIPCVQFARSEARALGPLAVALHGLGEVTGAARVTGTAQASGSFVLDTSAEEPVVLHAKTKETCGLSLFGW